MSRARISRLKNSSMSSSSNLDKLTTLCMNLEKISTRVKGPMLIGAPNKWQTNSKNSISPLKTYF